MLTDAFYEDGPMAPTAPHDPCRALWASVVLQGMVDVADVSPDRNSLRWFTGGFNSNFEVICTFLGLPIERTRERALQAGRLPVPSTRRAYRKRVGIEPIPTHKSKTGTGWSREACW